ncbi:MAG: aldehyde dehydrogenase family protein, partial [Verrucomicrobia bacterium]|nr:aldehyde dehydrogenase family protein [Verrucomicrobiota bacterium]
MQTATGEVSHPPAGVEDSTREIGERILALADQCEPPSLFSRKGLQGALMDWAMRDEPFKVQLFRFVDVLPTLHTAGEISRHLREYLDNEQLKLPTTVRVAIKTASAAGGLLGGGIKAQITSMARQFMLGDDPKEIVAELRRLSDSGIAFTADVLGEKVVSETEADAYAARYLELMELLARETAAWPPCRSDQTPRGALPRLNLSVKLSALYSQIHPADPDTAAEKISARLRPILRRAKELGAFINFDMEHSALKDLTLRIFKTVFTEPEFSEAPACGLAIQTYLRGCESDLRDLIAWARERRRRVTVRLVKGAYWDYETVIARQRGWPCPVFERKPESDANFEKLTVLLLENADAIGAAFGTHNVRSIAHALAQSRRLGLDDRDIEFQMLHGMAGPLKAALLQLGLRLREYCPVGELLPGMAYLVRRLLENTSNEGFLANKFAKGVSHEELLRSPREALAAQSEIRNLKSEIFQNEPLADFTVVAERQRLQLALQDLRRQLGQIHPLVINNHAVATREWRASFNPADQREIIGHAARATVADAEGALDAARAAQPAWARTAVEERAALLERLAGLMRRDKAALTALEVLEAGKNWTEADADVAEAIDYANFYAAEMRALGRPQRTMAVAGETNLQHWWPRGVGLVIAPWNFPLAILGGMTLAAVVAGNTVVMKPSDQTPVVAARLMALLIEAGLPRGVVNLITGRGSEVGAHLVAHPGVDFIAFTGSMEVGLKIWET